MTTPATDRRSLSVANVRARRQWNAAADALIAPAEDGRQTGEIIIRLKLVDGIVKKFAVALELEQYVRNDEP